jgi:peptidoglycan hydrolase-like protein with peptidoglycan-binding domain
MLSLVRDFDEINDVNMALLQQKLKLVMGEEFGSLQADGINGPRTQAALQAFLKRHNLKQDSRRGSDGPDAAPPPRELSPQATALLRESYLGELEANSLRAAAQATGAKPPPDAGIKLLQLVLNQVMRREVVTVDGVYGPRTRTAIDDFQKLFGLPVDGDVAAQLKTVAQALRAEKGPGAGQSEPAGGGAASATSPTTRPR